MNRLSRWSKPLTNLTLATLFTGGLVAIYLLMTLYQCDVCGADAFNNIGWHEFCDEHAKEYRSKHPEISN